jgi:hypothetical protein
MMKLRLFRAVSSGVTPEVSDEPTDALRAALSVRSPIAPAPRDLKSVGGAPAPPDLAAALKGAGK